MKRTVFVFLGWLALTMAALAGQPAPAGEKDQLQHDWREVQKGGEITLISNYPAPVPFSTDGQPEATLGMEAEVITPGKDTLESVVTNEVRQIREQLLIADYAEQDGKKPDKGIAVWYETIEGTRVAFIKYRVAGIVGKPPVLPLSVIHSLFIKGNKVFYTHLVVRYAGHQDEVRHDQRFIIRGMIESMDKRLAH